MDTGSRIEFVASDDYVSIGPCRGLAEAFRIFTGDQNGIVVEADTNRNPVLQFRFPAFTPIGIARQPSFGKSNEFGTVAGGLLYLATGAVHALFSVQVHRRRLYYRHFDAAATAEDFFCGSHFHTSSETEFAPQRVMDLVNRPERRRVRAPAAL